MLHDGALEFLPVIPALCSMLYNARYHAGIHNWHKPSKEYITHLNYLPSCESVYKSEDSCELLGICLNNLWYIGLSQRGRYFAYRIHIASDTVSLGLILYCIMGSIPTFPVRLGSFGNCQILSFSSNMSTRGTYANILVTSSFLRPWHNTKSH